MLKRRKLCITSLVVFSGLFLAAPHPVPQVSFVKLPSFSLLIVLVVLTPYLSVPHIGMWPSLGPILANESQARSFSGPKEERYSLSI